MKGSLVVKPHNPNRTRALLAVAVIASLAGAYGLYEYGMYRGGFERIASADERESLLSELDTASLQNSELRRRIAQLETSRGVDREAYDQVEGTLGDLQAQLQAQREELDFYRAIVTPADGVSGLRIQEFSVKPGVQDSLYRLRVVLVQAAKHDRLVSGVVRLSLDGAHEGRPVSYDLSEVTIDDSESQALSFSFRYFQNFEREVLLPDGFVPDRVNIEVAPRGSRSDVIRQSFDWAAKG